MASVTDISICSQALVRLAADPINSFIADDPGIICDQNYPTIKGNVLSRYPWRITMRQKKLQRDGTDPVAKWGYSHQVPNNGLDVYGAIRTLYPSDGQGVRATNQFKLFGKFVYSNHLELWADYQVDVAESDFPPYLVELMVLAVCAEIAEPISDQTSKVKTWEAKAWGLPGEQKRGGYFKIATSLDAQQAPIEALEDFPFTDVRNC